MKIYDYEFKNVGGKITSFEEYRGKALIIVNIASKCGFTPQLEELQAIYKEYKEQGLEIVGFPCNQFDEQAPGSSNDLHEFCKLNYGVTFKLSEKVEIRGANEHPVYTYLTKECPFAGFNKENMSDRIIHSITAERYPEYLVGDGIKWNFTKFLLDREGRVVKRFETGVEPRDMVEDIKLIL